MAETKNDECTVLWWSRTGREYSRNRVVRDAFQRLGWRIHDFAARTNSFGDVEARLRRIATPNLVWVPCFRHRELSAAARWAKSRDVPIAFDPLISAWDKQVFERRKFTADSWRAHRLLRWERKLFQRCDLVVADTGCHANFFREQFCVAENRMAVIPVGAEESLFRPFALREAADRTRVLFYGSFIALQAPDIIAEAAVATPDIDWIFIGDGPLRKRCETIAAGAAHVSFMPWVPYETLPRHIADAEILLGVFGESEKAARVIPNKVYQALACARVVVTRTSTAYPEQLVNDRSGEHGIAWVSGGDARELSTLVRALSGERKRLETLSAAARKTYESHFSNAAVTEALRQAIESLKTNATC
jgi:glycosyltransferase involved in cell wall biosynthesis